MKQIDEREIIVGPARLSYLTVFKPRHNKEKNVLEYGAVLLFPKKETAAPEGVEINPDEIREVGGAIKAALAKKFGTEFKGVWVSVLKDGDKELRKDDGEPKYPGYWFMPTNCKEDWPPLLVDGHREANGKLRRVTGGWQSGDWAKVKVSLYAYDQKGNKGVGAGLRAIQFIAKGDPMGGGGSTEEGFDEVAGAAATQPEEYDPFADE